MREDLSSILLEHVQNDPYSISSSNFINTLKSIKIAPATGLVPGTRLAPSGGDYTQLFVKYNTYLFENLVITEQTQQSYYMAFPIEQGLQSLKIEYERS